jgi:hypothetical protein
MSCLEVTAFLFLIIEVFISFAGLASNFSTPLHDWAQYILLAWAITGTGTGLGLMGPSWAVGVCCSLRAGAFGVLMLETTTLGLNLPYSLTMTVYYPLSLWAYWALATRLTKMRQVYEEISPHEILGATSPYLVP